MTIMPTNPWPENDPDHEYVPDSMGRLGRGIWRRRRRSDPFGRIAIDPDFERFRDDFDFGKPVGNIFRSRPFDLVAPVGRESENERFDVARIETLLAKAGFLDLKPTEGPTGYYGLALEDAIRKFQAAEDLKVDGLINPGGPTLSALAKQVSKAEAPERTRDEADRDSDPDGARKPVNLLEATMRRENKMIPPSPGEIFDGAVIRGGGGGLFNRRPALPKSLLPDVDAADPASPGTRAQDNSAGVESRREAIADDFAEDITAPLESHRGDDTTKKGNDIVARECRAILEEDYPDLADRIDHVHGATKDGSGDEKDILKEKYVPNKERTNQGLDARPGSNHPDLTWQDNGRPEGDPEAFAHANTATMGKRGKPIAEERRSYKRLVENVGEDLANMLPKLRPGMDEEKYRDDVREKCREIFGKWLGASRKDAPNGDEDGLSSP